MLAHLRLPLMRELSAKLTEGEIFDNQVNVLTYSAEIMVDVQIANSQYSQIHGFQGFCAESIFFCLFRGIVPSSIKFNDKSCFRAIKVCNIIANRFLPLKAHRIIS